MKNILLQLIGWKAILIQGDPTVTDRWCWLQNYIQSGAKRTLDAGCGQGQFTMYCSQLGNQSVGLAFSSQDIHNAQIRADILCLSDIEFQVVDLRHLDEFTDQLGTFDQILLLETLEHIFDDTKVLADIYQLLRPGGILLVTTPSIDHYPLWGEKLSEYEDGGHVRWGYSQKDLVTLLEKFGIEILHQDYISGIVSQKLASWEFGLRKYNTLLSRAVTLPLRIFHFLDQPLTKLLNYPHLSVGIVGRKPL
ncbi:class I SAM-dependent methyltransferase [Okeanomitos corallinicola TIOX110]|uniref:Class I SAM-dependent methyltransferase n=1 Tax=Okeanomitos corallinicola TIOX110 TaxID=3133117 RepID=A0ABZ2V1R4_9CYAN